MSRNMKYHPLSRQYLYTLIPINDDWPTSVFDLMDEDYDGVVGFDKFAKAVQIAFHGDIEAKANWVFLLMDIDADNRLSRFELCKSLHMFCNPSDEQRSLIKNWKMVFQEMDQDGDGWVSPEEFVESVINGGVAENLVDLILEEKGRILAVVIGLIRHYGYGRIIIPPLFNR